MTARGVHFALTENELAQLLACRSDTDRLTFIKEIEERLFDSAPECVAETDKAWYPIHFALNGGVWDTELGAYPATHVIWGGQSLYEGDDYYISLKTVQEVKEIAVFLDTIAKDDLRNGYMQINAAEYGPNYGDADFEYAWKWFQNLQTLWLCAAAENRSVIFTVAE